VTAASGRTRVDVGRLIMVPAAAVILFANLSQLGRHGPSGADEVLRYLSVGLALVFYSVLIWCYLRRSRAVATSGSVAAHIVAVTATWLPFVLPLLRGAVAGPGRQALADALLVVGTAWSVWALRSLGRNMSLLAQARDVVDQGPYHWVRHPLYAGEIVSTLGVAVAMNSFAAVALWVVFCGLQVYRASREEEVLLQTLPAYRSYRSRTAALLPGVF
jgi:protein-S-isoprenylcysteine O-methyltransferase Ste14